MASPSMAARMAAEVSGTVSGPKSRKASLSISMAPTRPMSSRFTRWISSVWEEQQSVSTTALYSRAMAL